MKKFIAFILAFVLLSNFAVLVSAEKKSAVAEGDIIEFGSYPQTQVTDENIISALNGAVSESEGYFEEYWCRTQPRGSNAYCAEKENMMAYKDVTYNNEKYRGIKINYYRPENAKNDSTTKYSEQDDNGYVKGNWYWFKYEPIQWIIFDADRMYAISKLTLDAQPFNNEYLEDDGMFMPKVAGGMKYANDFTVCHLKDYLRDVFMPMAFSSAEQEQLKEINVEAKPLENLSGEDDYMSRSVACTKVVVPTYEQVFGSEKEVTYRLGVTWFEDVIKDVFMNSAYTDYYKVQGGDCFYSSPAWWLATPDSYSGASAKYVGETGGIENAITSCVVTVLRGVRPVICLENVLAKQEEAEKENNKNGWFSKDKEDETPAIAEGECNSRIDWSLSEDGVLTISGKGEMPEWNDSASSMPPWYYDNRSDIKSVIVDGKITSIGKLAFYGCENLESVTIPKSVKYIGECAFNECNSLKEINYGSNAEDWAEVEINEDNIDLSQLTVNYFEDEGSGGNVAVIAACAVGGAALVSGVSVATLFVLRKKKKA